MPKILLSKSTIKNVIRLLKTDPHSRVNDGGTKLNNSKKFFFLFTFNLFGSPVHLLKIHSMRPFVRKLISCKRLVISRCFCFGILLLKERVCYCCNLATNCLAPRFSKGKTFTLFLNKAVQTRRFSKLKSNSLWITEEVTRSFFWLSHLSLKHLS